VKQFTPSQLAVGTRDSLIKYDAGKRSYTFRWTAPADDPEAVYALTPSWRIGVGHGTGSDTNDYGYMLMMNHFSTAGADAMFAFWRTYILTDEMVKMMQKYNMQWDWFIDSLEIGRLGNYYWSNEMSKIFYELNGYDVTPYLPMLFDNSYKLEGVDSTALKNDMTNAMTEAYIIFQQRLSDNLHTAGGKLRAQVSYGAALTTSSAERAVDIPETESLAFKLSVESMKLMSGGVHLSGAEEFSSETNNWIGVNNASYVDQLFAMWISCLPCTCRWRQASTAQCGMALRRKLQARRDLAGPTAMWASVPCLQLPIYLPLCSNRIFQATSRACRTF